MAISQQEAALAYRSGLRYIDLCDAYRASSVAHAVVLGRIAQGIQTKRDKLSPEEFTAALNRIAERRATAQRNYATFATRRLQVLDRLEELRNA